MPASNLTSRRLAVPALIAALVAGSLLPARAVFFGPWLHNAAMVLLWPSRWLNAWGSSWYDKPSVPVDKTLEGLRDELLTMEGLVRRQEAEVRRLREENAQLSGLRRFVGESYRLIPARVLGRSSDPAANTLLIDRGSRHGVSVGQIAVDGPSLLGRVVAVQHSSAAIEPLTAPGNLYRAVVGNEKERFVLLRSAGPDLLIADNIEQSFGVKQGDYVRLADDRRLTSWPTVAQYLILGRVEAVENDPNNPLWKRIIVRPLQSLDHLGRMTLVAPHPADHRDPQEARP